jgi:hypothetical protein
MNTVQIANTLKLDPITSKKFCGVFPSDLLPDSIERYPCGFVANTDPITDLERTELRFFKSEHKGEFFDSYGNAPDYYDNYLETT